MKVCNIKDLLNMTRQECHDWFLKNDAIFTRKEIAKQLECSTYTLREVAKAAGVTYAQGRRTKIYRFKDE